MVTAVMKCHVWSIMQGRLLFPSAFGMLAAFATGDEVLEKKPRLALALEICIVAVVALSLLYLGGENLFQFVSHVFPGFKEYVKTLRV
jgi:small neutral amino acid transporter SnatA (MarC family)